MCVSVCLCLFVFLAFLECGGDLKTVNDKRDRSKQPNKRAGLHDILVEYTHIQNMYYGANTPIPQSQLNTNRHQRRTLFVHFGTHKELFTLLLSVCSTCLVIKYLHSIRIRSRMYIYISAAPCPSSTSFNRSSSNTLPWLCAIRTLFVCITF